MCPNFFNAFVQYRADFPSGLQKLVVFVDLAPIFSQMADVVLRRQIQLATANLSEVFPYAIWL
jgi:centromere/kinetochore protein ZW10